MQNIDIHHIIPISLGGEDIGQNKLALTTEEHKQLHKTQNIPYSELRRFREKTNGILVPNNYFFDYKLYLWQEFFKNAVVKVERQKEKLGLLAGTSEKLELNELLELIIINQKIQVKKILGK